MSSKGFTSSPPGARNFSPKAHQNLLEQITDWPIDETNKARLKTLVSVFASQQTWSALRQLCQALLDAAMTFEVGYTSFVRAHAPSLIQALFTQHLNNLATAKPHLQPMLTIVGELQCQLLATPAGLDLLRLIANGDLTTVAQLAMRYKNCQVLLLVSPGLRTAVQSLSDQRMPAAPPKSHSSNGKPLMSAHA